MRIHCILTHIDLDGVLLVVYREAVCCCQHKVLRHHSPHAVLMAFQWTLGKSNAVTALVRMLASSVLRQHPVALLLSQTGSCCIALADLKLKVVLLLLPAAGDPPDPARAPHPASFPISDSFISSWH